MNKDAIKDIYKDNKSNKQGINKNVKKIFNTFDTIDVSQNTGWNKLFFVIYSNLFIFITNY